ncbi:MAG: hypothetical protein COA41_01875 [Sphingopyxis sp.]|nr:MAG: hypothetical protein COA41_01875 [Sphingopyxis sp.]
MLSEKPLRIGIIGCGSHVTKNIIPCLLSSKTIKIAAIYVRDVAKYASAHSELADFFTDNLQSILSNDSIKVIYIATPISSHYGYGIMALEAGKHVWCEKPLTANLEDSQALVRKAVKENLFLGEIAMYQHHAQFKEIKHIIELKKSTGERLISARARFSIPELDAGNIRYNKSLGGGALLDVGFYPLSSMVALFGQPRQVDANGFVCPQRGVDISGDALLHYDSFSAHCTWAIGSTYHNEMELSFSKSTIQIPRAYSKPADLPTALEIIGNFGQAEEPIEIAPDDHFANNFAAFAAAIGSSDIVEFNPFVNDLLNNAAILTAIGDAIIPGHISSKS